MKKWRAGRARRKTPSSFFGTVEDRPEALEGLLPDEHGLLQYFIFFDRPQSACSSLWPYQPFILHCEWNHARGGVANTVYTHIHLCI
jgi:hypothetical protein